MVKCGISSAVEHFVDIEGVTSSILVSRTTAFRQRASRPTASKPVLMRQIETQALLRAIK